MKNVRCITVLLLAAALIGISGCKAVTSTNANIYSVTVNVHGQKPDEDVTMSLVSAKAGDTVTLTAKLNHGRQVILTADGIIFTPSTIIANDGTATFIMPPKNITVTAVFTGVLHSITLTPQDAQTGEEITSNTASAKAGETITLTIKVNTNRQATLSADGVTFDKNYIKTNNTVTFSMPAKAVKITVEFTRQYEQAAYPDLETYLQNTAVTTGVNYIQLTGTIPPADLQGVTSHSYEASKLGKLLENYSTKSVALKLPASIPGLTDMSSAFYECTNLVSATIPTGVTSMRYTFSGCTGLTTAPAIPNSVTNMYGSFSGCTGLTTAPAIPNSVTYMRSTFDGCRELTSAPVIPDSVTDMRYTFSGCTGLTSAPAIPNSVTNMDGTFAGCTGLMAAPDIPASVTKMSGKSYWGKGCFEDCTKITTVTVHPPWSNLSSDANNYKNVFKGCTALIDGGIKVPAASLSGYQAAAAQMGTTAAKFAATP